MPSSHSNVIPAETVALFVKGFKGVVATESSGEDYRIERWSWQVAKLAAYVVYPTDADDISKAILFARGENLPIAIAGGRHNSAGASSSEGGLVIDMRRMKGIRLDKERMIVHVQGGTTISEVGNALIKDGLATTVGVCGTVGVVGLALGGGVGMAMGEHGLALDNIVSATVVLANGEVVSTSETEHPDLFWGLRGGGSNFGVVSELSLKCHPQRPDLYTLVCNYNPEELPALVAELNGWLNEQLPQESIFFTFMEHPARKTPFVGITAFCNYDEAQGHDRLGRFLKLGPFESKAAQVSYSTFLTIYDPACEAPGNKVAVGAHFDTFDYDSIKKVYDMWIVKREEAPTSVIAFELFDYRKVPTIPVHATAFAQRTADKTCLITLSGYPDPAETPNIVQSLSEMQACVSSSASSASTRRSLGHVNNADQYSVMNETDEYARQVFGPNYARLQQVKRTYDPEMVFNKWFCIAPAAIQ